MEVVVMRRGTVLCVGALLVVAAGCGGSPADMEELKKGQKDALAKLEAMDAKLAALDTAVKTIKTAAPAAPARPQIDPNKVYDIPVGNSAMKGAENGTVTIIKFSDYQCPFCAQSNPLIKQVLEAYPNDVKFVYKQFPLTSIHPNAMPAAKAVLAAKNQGKYWEMHDILFENYRNLAPDQLEVYAKQVPGLDVEKWKVDMNDPAIAKQIDAEMAEARAAGVTGTPTFFVNGKRVMNRSFDGFKQMVEAAKGAPAKQG